MSSILTKFQREILEQLSHCEFVANNFYFSGGTTLAEFYLHHRFSEDFDFFTDKEIDLQTIRSQLEPIFKKTSIKTVDYQEVTSVKIFFLKKRGEIIKTDFNFWAFERLEPGSKFNLLTVDSLLDIAVNKLHTTLSRKKARDFVDLYFILKGRNFTLDFLLQNLKKKYDWAVDPLYLASRFLAVENLQDYPKMIKEFSKKEMIEYFISLAKEQKDKIVY